VQPLCPRGKLRHEVELGRVVLAPVGHVHGGEYRVTEIRLDDARLHVELRVAELGHASETVLADMERHAGIRAHAVPEHVVVLELALRRHLRGLRLELLQAYDVRTVARQPLAKLRLARADAIDVPGRDFHFPVRISSSTGRR
jgi:hypothetical protein